MSSKNSHKFCINHHSVQLYNQFHTVEFRPRQTKFRQGFPRLAKQLITKRWSYSDAIFYNPRAVFNHESVTWNVTIEKLAVDRPSGRELEIGFSLTSCTPTKVGLLEKNSDCIVLNSDGWLSVGSLPKDKITEKLSEGDKIAITLDFREGNGCLEFVKNGETFGMMPYDVNSLEDKQPLKLCTCRLMVGLWAGDRITLH